MKTPGKRSVRIRRTFGKIAVALAVLYLVLLIPDRPPTIPTSLDKQPFIWNRDAFWSALERQFKEARAIGCEGVTNRLDAALRDLRPWLAEIAAKELAPTNPEWERIETELFQLAPLFAACQERLPESVSLFSNVRESVKRQSEHWNMDSPEARQTIYRLLYGARAALEEVTLQAPPDKVPALIPGRNESSRTPSTTVSGVTIHSGDIFVSRGGAPTSALIARGNDYPGNFSHIALVHVDADTRTASIIEAHIERGVVISTLEDYLNDKKLRVMALRPRIDLPGLVADPMLPHKAASAALDRAKARHIPYDFEMNFQDHSKQFCSEVASAAYEQAGIRLWMGVSRISSIGTISWLSAFGVRYFETQEPSDLEYDPQLCVVAEWRDPKTLFQDHADNAVTDVLLEEADAGKKLDYSWVMLPIVRLTKAYCVILNRFGSVGPVPEGMSATAALRHRAFSKRHAMIRNRLLALADAFRKQNGYNAPYWELVKLARQSRDEVDRAAR